MKKNLKSKYSFKNYKPTKKCIPVTYKGKNYLSKTQCMVLEGITKKELEEYLKNVDKPAEPVDDFDMIEEIIS